jgi:hypothetical protein
MGLVTMTTQDLERAECLSRIVAGAMSMVSAATVLNLSVRQVQRLVIRFRTGGTPGIGHKARGRRSNNRYPDALRRQALDLIRSTYTDFGPSFACEKLVERHGLRVSRETLRQWMLDDGLWLSRDQRRRFHQPRLRREQLGELIQIDGSEHRWFEDRGPPCTLLVFIDDATSRLMQMRFVPSESTFSYFAALESYLTEHGRPVAFYSDKHSIFRVSRREAKAGDGMTQFGRALSELGVEIICASSSQAKGRVERANRTLQNRLVKEMRLAGVSDMATGNAFLPGFVADHNWRFGRVPLRAGDMHRPLNLPPSRLGDILCWRELRYVGQDLTFRYEGKRIMLEQTELTRQLPGQYVETLAFADGRFEARWKGVPLPHRVFDRDQKVSEAAIVENKRLGEVLAYIKAVQDTRPPRKADVPKRPATTYQPTGKRAGGPRSFVDKHIASKGLAKPPPSSQTTFQLCTTSDNSTS